jgi:uncharacterized protein (TIGR02996 family)
MSDEPALLQAVLAQPDTDVPRLAYAEWLNNQPGQKDRAEFIRTQIEIEQLRNDDRRWPDLVRKERQLLERYRTTWERPFRNLLTPSILKPMDWLKVQLFGAGGVWHFHRGFIAEISTSARRFLRDEVKLFEHAPIRQVVLMNASSMISGLILEPRLNGLRSLHLVSDVEFDEDMEGLRHAAKEAGLRVIELRYPRVDSDADVLFSLLRGNPDDDEKLAERLEEYPNWARATPRERDRLKELTTIPRFLQYLTEPENTSHSELLRVNDWIYLGDRLREAGVWAVAKTYHDLEDEAGTCRRLALFKPEQLNEDAYTQLLQSPHLRPSTGRDHKFE